MVIYIAGPMRGKPEYNYPAFDEAARRIGKRHEVINPARMDRDAGWTVESIAALSSHDMGKFIRDAMQRNTWFLCHAEAIALLPGWENSVGTAVEIALGKMLGLAILDAETLEPVEAA
jgi:hypothetical protein